MQAGVLANVVAFAGVVEAPVGQRLHFGPLDQGVTELVKHHLRQAVVPVEGGVFTNRHDASAVGRCVDLGRAPYAKADARGDR